MDNSTTTNNQEVGKQGESLAVTFLEQNGYTILETNWRFGQSEADIICKKKGELVFVEVKTRGTDKFGYPERAVTKQKQRQYQFLAEGYIQKNKLTMDVRFDIISIVHHFPEPEIVHIKDAFYPTNF